MYSMCVGENLGKNRQNTEENEGKKRFFLKSLWPLPIRDFAPSMALRIRRRNAAIFLRKIRRVLFFWEFYAAK